MRRPFRKAALEPLEPRTDIKPFFRTRRVADLPYLDAKTEYIHESTPGDILDADAPTISLVEANTLASLHAKLAAMYASGTASGFALVAPDGDDGPERMYAYVASKELEHGIARARARGLPETTRCGFGAAEALARVDVVRGRSVVDLGWLVDQAPLTVNARSPMELLHEVRLFRSLSSSSFSELSLGRCSLARRCSSSSASATPSSSTSAACTAAS